MTVETTTTLAADKLNRPRDPAPQGTPAVPGFDALLEVARMFDPLANGGTYVVREQQMFEPPATSADGAGHAQESEPDSAMESRLQQSRNRSGVDARTGLARSTNGGGSAARNAGGMAGGDSLSRESGTGGGSERVAPQEARSDLKFGGADRTGGQPAPDHGGGPAQTLTKGAVNNQGPSAGVTVPPVRPADSSMPAEARAVAPINARTVSTANPAKIVAQVLARGGGEAEGSRAASQTASSSQGRAGDTGDRAAARADRGDGERSPAPKTAEPRAGGSEFDKLVRSLRLMQGLQRSTARMHLDPPTLGRMTVDLRYERGVLRVDVRTETAEARDLLYDRVAQLRAALEQHGIRIDRFEVVANLHPDPAYESTQPEVPFDDTRTGGQEDAGQASADGGEGRSGEPAPQDPTAEEYQWQLDAEARLDVRA